MWTVAAANKRSLGNYNGLTDQHLAHYFSSPVIKAHLIKTGLVTKDGIIIPESDLKLQYIQKQRQRDYKELLANAIVQKALHLEHVRQAKIRQHLEDIAKIELVERIKRPHTVVGTVSKSCKQPTVTESPYQYSCSSVSLKGSLMPSKRARSSDSAHRKLKTTVNKKLSRSISSSKSRDSDYDFRNMGNISPFQFQQGNKAPAQNKRTDVGKCKVTLFYHGNKIFWWMNKLQDEDQEIIVKQQHCGGSPVVVFKGTKNSKEYLSFTSHRHAGYPFSITIFIDGMRDLKLSACCEYRYQRGSRLGGKTGHFSFVSAEGGNPCTRCQAVEYKWISRSPVLILPKDLCQISPANTHVKREPCETSSAENTTNFVGKENFTFTKEDNIFHTESSNVVEEEIEKTIDSIQDDDDDDEIPDEVESLKTDENEGDQISSADGSPESVKSEPHNPTSEANEAYSEVDAGPEQCVDLEYDNDSVDGETSSHRTVSSNSDVIKQPLSLKVDDDDEQPHNLNLDVRSMSEDEGGEEHIVIAEVHASDRSDI